MAWSRRGESEVIAQTRDVLQKYVDAILLSWHGLCQRHTDYAFSNGHWTPQAQGRPESLRLSEPS